MAGKKKNKGRTSIFTGILKAKEAKEKAVARAGGAVGRKGKRLKVTPLIPAKKKKKAGVKRLGR